MTVYPIRSPRASVSGFTPEAAPEASPSAAPATGAPASASLYSDTPGTITIHDGPRPPSMRALADAPRATERLATIRAKDDARIDVWPQTKRLVDALEDARGDLSLYRSKHGDAASEAEIARLQREIDHAQRALDEHRKSTAAMKSAGQAWPGIYAKCVKAINTANERGTAFEDTAVNIDRPEGTEDAAPATYSDVLERLGELAAEMQAVEQAWLPIETTIAQMRERVERMAASGLPRAQISLQFNGPHDRAKLVPQLDIVWPRQKVEAAPWPADSAELPHVIDTAAVCCALFKDQIIAALEEQIEEAYRSYDSETYSSEARRNRLAELAAMKLYLERLLAELTWRDIDGGDTSATFPGDMSPLAILGVSEVRRTA